MSLSPSWSGYGALIGSCIEEEDPIFFKAEKWEWRGSGGMSLPLLKGWYWWGSEWSEQPPIGPYQSRLEAEIALQEYCNNKWKEWGI